MKSITNIKLEKNSIIITYSNETKNKIPYNKTTKLEIIDYLKDMKSYYLYEKKILKKKLIKTSILTLLESLITSVLFILSNNIFLDIFLSIIAIDIVLVNSLFLIYFKNDYQDISELLNIIETNKLPNEDKFLENRKIVNFQEYLMNKKYQELFNYHDYNYPKENNNNQNNECKILEFKRK